MIKTKSVWGQAPSRIYKFLRFCLKTKGVGAKIGVIGCSDGKFVFPFLRKGFNVTGFEMDKTAIFGGDKIEPALIFKLSPFPYVPSAEKIMFDGVPSRTCRISGILERARLECLTDKLEIIDEDFYHGHHSGIFDVTITSCSMQYKSNRDLTLNQVIGRLQDVVAPGGYLYMDYMMPLEDRHSWKSPLFPRTGKLKEFFSTGWSIVHNREMRQPVFEGPHIDRPSPHFHRFGYILAVKGK